MSTTYLTAETQTGAANITGWKACNAKSLSAAKRIAQARRAFQRTDAHVGTRHADGSVTRIATRRPAGEVNAGWSEAEEV